MNEILFPEKTCAKCGELRRWDPNPDPGERLSESELLELETLCDECYFGVKEETLQAIEKAIEDQTEPNGHARSAADPTADLSIVPNPVE